MKIGVYNPYLDNAGGGEKYMMDLALFLAKEHEVHLFWDNPEDLHVYEKRFEYDLKNVKVVSNIFNPSVSMHSRLFKSMRYDMIIVLSDGSIPVVWSKKLYLHFQQPIQRPKLSFVEKFKMRGVTKVFCNSVFTKSYVDTLFGVDSSVLYPLIEPTVMDVPKENIIMHMGSFRLRENGDDFKKQAFMLRTFAKEVAPHLNKWEFVLAASVRDADKPAFISLQRSMRNAPVTFVVNPSKEKLWEYFNKAKIYWHASGYNADGKPELAEHFGITTVEAMSTGTVPVVFNAGGQREIVENGENGYLWNTKEEFVSETIALTKPRSEWEKLSKNAQQKAREFGRVHWEAAVKTIFS